MKYEFRVMREEWSLEAPDDKTACLAICYFLPGNMPGVMPIIITPLDSRRKPFAINVEDYLEEHRGEFDAIQVRPVMKTIRKIEDSKSIGDITTS